MNSPRIDTLAVESAEDIVMESEGEQDEAENTMSSSNSPAVPSVPTKTRKLPVKFTEQEKAEMFGMARVSSLLPPFLRVVLTVCVSICFDMVNTVAAAKAAGGYMPSVEKRRELEIKFGRGRGSGLCHTMFKSSI